MGEEGHRGLEVHKGRGQQRGGSSLENSRAGQGPALARGLTWAPVQTDRKT